MDRYQVTDVLMYHLDAAVDIGSTEHGLYGTGEDVPKPPDLVEFRGSYSRRRAKVVLVNPAAGQQRRYRSDFRNCEISGDAAIEELDLESDRFETRGWYDGLSEEDLQGDAAVLDPAVWCGI